MWRCARWNFGGSICAQTHSVFKCDLTLLLIPYMSSLRGGGSGFCTLSPPLCRSPPGWRNLPIFDRVSGFLRIHVLFHLKEKKKEIWRRRRSIRRIIYKFLNVCPFNYTAVAVSGKVFLLKGTQSCVLQQLWLDQSQLLSKYLLKMTTDDGFGNYHKQWLLFIKYKQRL